MKRPWRQSLSTASRDSAAASASHAPDSEAGAESPPEPAKAGSPATWKGSPKTQAKAKSVAADKPPVSIKALNIKVPDQIGRYTIGRRIGSGTCGVVHHALDNLLGREVAVKLSPMGEAHVSTGKVPGAQRAYQTELIAAGKLTHPNIVTVFDAGQYENLNYLVMEAVEGNSLKEYGKGKTLLPVAEALRIICACCEGLDYSHKQGILHRDIKPANIMLSVDGSVKLLDFGIAVGLTSDSALKKKGPTLGTPNYMSPEQILGRDLAEQSDFYSLATVLFELLTGRQLFKAKKVKDLFRTVVHQKAPRLNDIRPDLPSGLADVLAKALEKRPHLRFNSGAEMAKAIEPYLRSYLVMESRPAPQRRLIKRLKQQLFFRTFSDFEVALLLERLQLRTYSPLQKVYGNGEQSRRVLLITNGVVRCEHQGSISAVIGVGECIGEAGFINGVAEPRRFTALTDVSALEFDTNALAELPPKVHLRYYRHISDILTQRQALGDQLAVDVSL